MYRTQHDELFAAIRTGQVINDCYNMAKSSMVAIMGRMAAYTGQRVTWEEAINSDEVLIPDSIAWGEIPNSGVRRSEEHTSELQSRGHLVCRLLLEKKNKRTASVVKNTAREIRM